ncbi:hypothetical protein LYSHEL_00260 [Lysobacter helvus]|uniref:YcxB-like C-terminal domain-containing protein n=2 Tax=Lysobacteraceae TaxID=32033 RepID=A0ABN6FNC8_9GAMM|nr:MULTISPECIES: YcxB family protein [Lysobacter]BCT91002.1 hypothetical protein LYSCAS_00260 [Lysobacter caseinilyticus]BCT94155.1 hypothetical protein LYSHEL_00260 [Lysobacter helvus]
MTPTAIHLPDVRMTFAECVKALALVSVRVPKLWACMALFCAGGLAVLILSSRAGQLDAGALAAGLAGIAFVPGLLVAAAWNSRRAQKSAVAYRFTAEGLHISTQHSQTQMSWTNIRNMRERGGFLMLRIGEQCVLCMPRRLFGPTEVGAVRALARDAGVEGA